MQVVQYCAVLAQNKSEYQEKSITSVNSKPQQQKQELCNKQQDPYPRLPLGLL